MPYDGFEDSFSGIAYYVNDEMDVSKQTIIKGLHNLPT